MCVLCDDGTAFVGDAAMNSLNFAGARYRPIYYNDLEQTYNSIKKIIASGAKTIMPAHGEPFDVKELQDMLAHFNV
jgi:glyoxylase-like metal-dependent hydrolase (beta-lactamase superfamily II)